MDRMGLTATEIEFVLQEALDLLEKVGVAVQHAALAARLQEAGARKGTNGRLHLPPTLVHTAINTTPAQFILYDRDGVPFTTLGEGKPHFIPGSSGLKVLDHRTDAVRLANTADFVEYVRLADGLAHIDYLATAFSTNDDIEPAVADAWRLYLCLTQSRKPVVSGAFTAHGVPRMAEMLALFRRDRADLRERPCAVFTITATGIFRYGEDSCQNLVDCLNWGIPIEIVPVTLLGLIAPVTLLEAAAFHVADCLAGLVMAQVLRPGAPVLFGGAPAAFHMQTATAPMAAIEVQRLNLAYAAVAKSLGLPTQAYMALSDAKTIDAQAGGETFASALLAALAGIDAVSGPGFLDYLLVFSLEKLVLDNEICGQVRHFLKETADGEVGMAVTLAQSLLEEEHLLTHPHTEAHWREALYLPGPIWERQTREDWVQGGRPSLRARAQAAVENGLGAYTAVETDLAIMQELTRIIHGGLQNQTALPSIPPLRPKAPAKKRRRHRRRRL